MLRYDESLRYALYSSSRSKLRINGLNLSPDIAVISICRAIFDNWWVNEYILITDRGDDDESATTRALSSNCGQAR